MMGSWGLPVFQHFNERHEPQVFKGDNKQQIDVSEFNDGIYLLVVKDGGKVLNKTFVVMD